MEERIKNLEMTVINQHKLILELSERLLQTVELLEKLTKCIGDKDEKKD